MRNNKKGETMIDEKNIIGKMEWTPLNQIPSATSQKSLNFWSQYPSSAGVYQVIESRHLKDVGDSIMHKEIGYSGKSGNLSSRVYDVRAGSNHGCGKYIKSKNWDKKDILVRVLFTVDDLNVYTDLETSIHEKSDEEFGYRFKWKYASAGNDGNVVKILDILPKLNKSDMGEIFLASKQFLSEMCLEDYLDQIQ